VLHLMISLCPGRHAKLGRTKAVLSQMPALLLELWREQHPLGHEQTTLDFKAKYPAANTAPLFLVRIIGHRQTNTLETLESYSIQGLMCCSVTTPSANPQRAIQMSSASDVNAAAFDGDA
jgi:hypothetical protein